MKKKFHLNGKEKAAMLLFGLCVVGSPVFLTEQPEAYQASVLTNTEAEQQPIFSPAQELKKMIENEEKEKLLQTFAATKNGAAFLEDAYHWQATDEIEIFEIENGFFLSLLGAKQDLFHPYFGFFNTEKNEVFWGKNGTAKIQSAIEIENNFVQVLVRNTGEYPWIVRSNWINKATKQAVEMISQKDSIPTNEEVVLLMKKSENMLLHNADIGFDIIFEE